MATRPIQKSDSNLTTYPGLLKQVRQTLVLGQKKIDQLKVETYWETGRLIHTHILHQNERADYGERVLEKLSEDLDVGERLLQRTLQFYREFPQIPTTWTELSWSHYRILSGIPDPKKRLALANRADREGWSTTKLEERVKVENLKSKAEGDDRKPSLLQPRKGILGLYRIAKDAQKLALDLGFETYLALNAKENTRLKAGMIVKESARGKIEEVKEASVNDLYTYQAQLVRVVDGDTLWMKIWLKKPLWVKEKLRLRGIDTPELGTPEGRTAKRFLEDLISKAKKITITTTKPDKWDRYLSDVFLATLSGEEIFLNNLLLEQGHALRKDKFTLYDWEK